MKKVVDVQSEFVNLKDSDFSFESHVVAFIQVLVEDGNWKPLNTNVFLSLVPEQEPTMIELNDDICKQLGWWWKQSVEDQLRGQGLIQ
ncbi:hypothetical protein AU106_gp102 [Sinorhizobium phage phiM9]|uniref:Uncharacterized protein n=1 Tax=Sinorhizobium phage phiM9 TaxID=1636182 RepID=A0A0F6R7J0_9CAUD|nr:hypothetical protein AU106_gp102 [Sinorhizobium phage phiM9]AKE44733.1 hypothetical protein Sm_phiM9_105 [Sinorhizobium phage phiM9]